MIQGNKKDVEKIMKKMGMELSEMDAKEVIIKTSDYQIRIENPEVIIANILGKKVYQISGEEKLERLEPKEEDVKLVMEKTGKDRETVVNKLKELNNDLARAIIELTS
ncbi:MAG: nascent polypeptide-associated complex protein [Candidatus Aenigmatarchaeota archaeon]|nr:nascent polypeptide-associated complex protein [Candidatus Aenigmarchaeota archaeon]